MKQWIDRTLNGLSPHLTTQISSVAQAAIEGAQSMTKGGSGLITQDGNISKSPYAYGFAFEHLQVLGYNIRAAIQNSSNRAEQIPANGTYLAPDIRIENAVGKTIAQIQAKVGSSKYLREQATKGYAEPIITNAENAGMPNTQVIIDVDGVQSFPINRNFADWVAKNPILAANLLQAAAMTGEVVASGVTGAAINTSINTLMQSIKVVGAYCRGEQALATSEVKQFLKVALEGLKRGFVRGAAIKCIERLSGSSKIGVLGFSITSEITPVMIKLVNEDITLDQAIASVGPRLLASGFVTTVVMLFPPVGTTLFAASLLKAFWEELTPEWQTYIALSAETTVRATGKGLDAGHKHLLVNPWDVIGASSASSAVSSAEMQTLQSE